MSVYVIIIVEYNYYVLMDLHVYTWRKSANLLMLPGIELVSINWSKVSAGYTFKNQIMYTH